ncbi:MAG TPA: RNA ligase family protein [Alphaproteobacteria bacterium]|nr:RNA ligase family protein [Alphaproteobacteria bacterium]
METLSNFPKIECPFIRKNFEVNKDDWKKYGKELQMREPSVYLVINEINPGYEWVFEDKDVIASEKLDGTNVKLKTENGRLISLMNRKNVIDPLQIIKGKTFIIEGVFRAIQKGYIEPEGVQAGEVIGPKLQGNPYKLNNHIWYPFDKAVKHLAYRSFYEHERTFDNWSSWFKDYLGSRFAAKRGEKDIMAEGVVFHSPSRKAENKIYMAKLRRNMFDWFYSDKIEIYK